MNLSEFLALRDPSHVGKPNETRMMVVTIDASGSRHYHDVSALLFSANVVPGAPSCRRDRLQRGSGLHARGFAMIPVSIRMSERRWLIALSPSSPIPNSGFATVYGEGMKTIGKLDLSGFYSLKPITVPLSFDQMRLALFHLQEKRADLIDDSLLVGAGDDEDRMEAWDQLRRGGFYPPEAP